jgi:fructan beta-fructosidase
VGSDRHALIGGSWQTASHAVVLAAERPSDDLLSLRGGPMKATPHWRPRAHFTATDTWLNDPNGLVFHDGIYHLYFQNNPSGVSWGDIAWGHATSTDLVTWTEHAVAIPATDDEMVYSGSAVVDVRNTAGFGPSAIIAVYTSSYRPGSPREGLQAQSLAVSLDEGYTFERFVANPVLDEQLAHFRDPKVFWFGDDDGHWVMAVAEPHEHRVRFYTRPTFAPGSTRRRSGLPATSAASGSAPT